MQSILFNLSLFKAGWLASVFTAAASIPAAGASVVVVVALTHLLFSRDARAELQLLLFAALLGFGWETFLIQLGLVQYDVGTVIPGVAPYWIVAMWVLFATTLNVGMRWLQKHVAVAALAGAIGGPLSFFAGAQAGAISFPDATLALIVIGLGWAVLLPLLVRFAARRPLAHERHSMRLEEETSQ